MKAPLRGLILIGGRSRRMGQDKSLMRYGSLPQWRHLVKMLQKAGLTEVFLSGRARQLAELDYPYKIPDRWPDRGPLGGIASAFALYPENAWFLVPCDLPLLDQASIVYMILHRNPARAATLFQQKNKKHLEPLLAIWEPSMWPVIQAAMRQKRYGLQGLLHSQSLQLLSPPTSKALFNANTREEAALGRAYLKNEQQG